MKNEKKRCLSVTAVILMIALIVLAASGCEKEVTTPVKEKEIVEIWHYMDLSYQQKALADLIVDFNMSQEEIEVTARYIPDADMRKKLVLGIFEGKTPDIALVDSSDFPFFEDAQPFADLTGRVEGLEKCLPMTLAPCTIGDQIKGQPFGVNCIALLYNEQMLKDAGLQPPATWEEFYETAKALTGNGVYGYAQSALKSEESVYTFLPMFWSMGGNVEALNEDNSRKPFEMLRKMAQEGIINRESINLTSGDIARQFCKGKIAMMLGSSMQVHYIEKSNPEISVGVTEIPSDNKNQKKLTISGGEIFGVLQGEQEEASIAFLNYISDKDRLTEYMDRFGYISAREDVLEMQLVDRPLEQKYMQMFEYARQREILPEWPVVSYAVTLALEETICGEEDVDVILRRTEEEIQKIREESR